MDLKSVFDSIGSVLTLLAPSLKKADSKHSVKELREALVGLNEISLLLIVRLKDGLQLGEDISAVLDKWKNDAAFKAKLVAAGEGIGKIPDEASDVDWGEVLELLGTQVSYVDDLIEAGKKVSVPSLPTP